MQRRRTENVARQVAETVPRALLSATVSSNFPLRCAVTRETSAVTQCVARDVARNIAQCDSALSRCITDAYDYLIIKIESSGFRILLNPIVFQLKINQSLGDLITKPPVNYQSIILTNTETARAELLEAWLALTSVKYHDNLLILMLLNQWLALTMLRTTGQVNQQTKFTEGHWGNTKPEGRYG